jgi:diguanylate cyclase (GGDEF)-like protein
VCVPEAPTPPNESERIRSLHGLGVLDTPPEEQFDRLTRLARRLFDVPMAAVTLVDTDRQWFKSKVGLDIDETPRAEAFCAHAILDDDVMVVSDATRDARFEDNPLVRNAPGIRFYAGAPVKAPDGSPLGTLCVLGHEARDFDEDDQVALRDLADIVEEELRAYTLATMDDLTGLSNRRGFEALATQTLALARRNGRPATLLMFDLDDFKEVNDTLGHPAGDRVLRTFADALVASFRDSDVVARLGGDEFCVLVSGTPEENVARPLEVLETRLAEAERGDRIAFSVGAASYDPDVHASIADLAEAADGRMYEHKRRAKR